MSAVRCKQISRATGGDACIPSNLGIFHRKAVHRDVDNSTRLAMPLTVSRHPWNWQSLTMLARPITAGAAVRCTSLTVLESLLLLGDRTAAIQRGCCLSWLVEHTSCSTRAFWLLSTLLMAWYWMLFFFLPL